MARIIAPLIFLASWAATATSHAQVFDQVNLDRLNRKLCGRVVDHTWNHGSDLRLYSPILGMKRDLYVYLPPGYDPSIAYPLVVYLHGADLDEHAFLDPKDLLRLDGMMLRGEMPRAVIAAPDGTYDGKNRIIGTHSLFVNGLGGRFEDHVVEEVVPYLLGNYSIRPEARAHALLGISAGGFGAIGMALKHRDLFGVVATLGGPLNMLYYNCQGRYGDDFDPATYRERTVYNPNEIIARYYGGLVRRKVKTFLRPVYGSDPGLLARLRQDNPADLLTSTNLQPGDLAIYVAYPGLDQYNFDAQDESFAWLAGLRGVAVTLVRYPKGKHNLPYFEVAEPPAFEWLGRQLLPPCPRG
jgi:poly(3-hydroxybutyrate) depolymerase